MVNMHLSDMSVLTTSSTGQEKKSTQFAGKGTGIKMNLDYGDKCQ